MQITTEIDFELDLDDTMREIAEEVVEANYCDYVTQDDVESLVSDMDQIMTWDDYQDGWHDQLNEYVEAMQFITASDLEDGDYIRLGDRYFEGLRADVAVLANDLEIARRSIRVLLADRERTLGRRARRLFTLTRSTFGRMVRRVHWHMPRR